MNDFVRCNKLSGVYWIKGSLQNLKINIKLKPPDDVISLPNFEDYANETSNRSLEQNIEEHSFKWQEKSFSNWEIQRYSDVHNCLTENERQYHELIENNEIISNKVFTYIHEDYNTNMPLQESKKVNLNSCLEHLSLEDVIGRLGDVLGRKTVSQRNLFKSQENVCDDEQQWMAMHVVFDHSEYNEDILLLKQESTLLSLYHNTTHNYIIISPDANSIETNPYSVETRGGEPLGYQYEVDVDFGRKEGSEDLVNLLKEVHKKWEIKHKHLVNFVMPPLGKTQYYVTIDIASAMGFDIDNLYIEYDIKIPEGLKCNDTLHGRTHVSESVSVEEQDNWNFGHIVELSIEVDYGIEPPPIHLYLESISTDFWNRHRTEGYAHLRLPLTPGLSTKELCSVRPDEWNSGERRFFVGGCHLIKDLEVLSKPELQKGDYTYTETGTILVRSTIISQSPKPGTTLPSTSSGVSSSSALLLGAEAALKKYKKARARLAAATKDLSELNIHHS